MVKARINKDFDFFGQHFRSKQFAAPKKTKNYLEISITCDRLYEIEPGEILSSTRLGEYVQR